MTNMADTYTSIGKNIPRVDGFEKAVGEARYSCDIQLPGMLHAAILPSPYAHARIISIDTGLAEKLPGVKAIITGKDIPNKRFYASANIPGLDDKLPIEKEKVRYIGDDVAAVAAVDIETAENALELIKVEYEELSPVLDAEKAMAEGSPLVHDDKARNISVELHYDFGDVDRAFKEADFIFEDTFRTSHAVPCCMETHSCVARWDKNGRLTMWVSTQLASVLRRELSSVLGVSFDDIRIIQTTIGGSFGSKMRMHSIEPIAAHLAKKTGRAVKLIFSRDEEFISTRTRHPSIIKIKTGVMKDGAIVAREAGVILDNGAYNSQGPVVLDKVCTTLCAHYNVRNTRVNGYLVYTNKPWGSAFRGFGNPQTTFAVESQMDIIAEKLGIDPVELRLRNAVKPGDVTSNGWAVSSCGMTKCIEKAAEAIDWKNKRGKGNNRGVGLAACIHWGGGIGVSGASNLCSAIIQINTTGQAMVFIGCHEIGEGAITVLTQIVAEEMGIPERQIRIMPMDTETSPSFFFVGSATTFVAGNAVQKAAADALKQVMAVSAAMYSVSPDSIEIKNGMVCDKKTGKELTDIGSVARHSYEIMGNPLVGKVAFDQGPTHENVHDGYGQCSPTYNFIAQAAEVEVDPETGAVKVLKFVSANDGGVIINPIMAEGQTEGALAQGLGFALTEGLVFRSDGKAMNPSFTDYKVFRAQDMPDEIIVMQVETVDPRGPFGAKSMGEAVMVPIAPAIANAIADATGLRMKELPITPEKIAPLLGKGGAGRTDIG